MGPSELLVYLARVLDDLELRYLVTGSTATIFYGEPRLTNDIDVVVTLKPAHIEAFCRCFPASEFYISREAVVDAVANFGEFNIIHPASGLKIDVMIPDDSPYNRSRLQRRRRESVTPDVDVSFASAEDVIVKKLEYYKLGGSEKHLRDITGVLKIRGAKVDTAYIAGWAARLGLAEVWEAVVKRVAE